VPGRTDLAIRPARADDAPRVHELHTVSVRTLCSAHYAADVIEGWLVNRAPADYLRPIERGDLFVAERDGRVVGFGEAAPGRVIAVYVDPAAVRQGVGRAILRHAIGKARGDGHGPVRLEATLNARAFYAREGFHELARFAIRRNHVDVPVVFMELGGGERSGSPPPASGVCCRPS
jgi:GNAT superfamily N-acetyltransferase